MEGIGFARDDKRDGLDASPVDLVRTSDLAVTDIEGASGEEAHATLGLGGLVFREGE